MSLPRFSLKTLVFLVTLAAVLLAWWVDHRNSAIEKRELDRRYREMKERVERKYFSEELKSWTQEALEADRDHLKPFIELQQAALRPVGASAAC